jgi:hypothetical protein
LAIAAGLLVALTAARHAATIAREKVVITFEGPWAFAADPTDATSIYAFAPKTMTHSDLEVQYADAKTELLGAGIYEVSLHANHVRSSSGTAVDPNVLQAKIDAQGVQHALDDRSQRYAIRLPRPEAYVAGPTGRMRAGPAYPPGPSTEKNYAMSVSLRYRAATLAGFTVMGRPDDGAFPFHPVLVEIPNLSFSIRPLPGQMEDECETHNREAFRDLAKLVNVKMFVDFGKFGDDCHATDPQKPPA